jgi:thioredoxin 1
MGSLLELDEKNFEEKVLKSNLPVAVDFSAEWCHPCKVLAPVIEQIAKEYEGKAIVARLDVDAAQDLARQYRVMSVPTVLFFKGGKVVSSSVGLVPKERLAETLDEIIAAP